MTITIPGIVLYLFQIAFFVVLTSYFHELGHASVAWFYGVKVKKVGWAGLKGAYIKRDRAKVSWHEFLISAAGPCANLVLAAYAYYIGQILLCQFNLILAGTNLIPTLPQSDGARLAKVWEEL